MDESGAHGKEVFRRSTMNRIASADELDHYIKVTNPSAWVVLVAALLLVAGVLVWAVMAVVPVTIKTTGVVYWDEDANETTAVCWVNQSTADKIKDSGAFARVGDVEVKDVEVLDTPMSASEVISFLGSDFYADSLNLDDWNYIVDFEFDGMPTTTDFDLDTKGGNAKLVPVSIVVSEKNPINIVLGNE